MATEGSTKTSNEALSKLTTMQKTIVEKVLENLENENNVWKQSWMPKNGVNSMPHNITTGRAYKGLNAVRLLMQGYEDPRWLTFNQLEQMDLRFKTGPEGESIAKGHGVPIEIYREYDNLKKRNFDRNDPEFVAFTEDEKIKYMKENVAAVTKSAIVFNASLVNGIESYVVPEVEVDTRERNEKLDKLMNSWEAKITYNAGLTPCYMPSHDSIAMPESSLFESKEAFYGTALHEIGHSTGHRSRLNRDLSGDFGTELYAKEELKAEFGAVLMCIEHGVTLNESHIQNHAAYIQNWQQAIRDNPKELINAIRDAQRIATYVNEKMAVKDLNQEDGAEDGTQPAERKAAPAAGINEENNVGEITQEKPIGKSQPPAWAVAKRERTFKELELNIPDEMKKLTRWCAFSVYKQKDSTYKKSIYDCNKANERKWASCSDETTWTTFGDAMKYGKEHGCDGITFALRKADSIYCIDLDHSVSIEDKKKTLTPFALEVLSNSNETYCETSTSGKGLHLFGFKSKAMEGHPVFDGSMTNRSKDNELELYDSSRFICMTGSIYGNSSGELKELQTTDKLTEILQGKLIEKPKYTEYTPKAISNRSTQEVFDLIMKSKVANEFSELYAGIDRCGDHSRSDYRLCSIVAWFSNGNRAITKEIFMTSKLYRPEKHPQYVNSTVEKACKSAGAGIGNGL